MAEQFDIAIVGAGLVGSSLACALGGSALKICLIEAKSFDQSWPDHEYDSRVCALTPATRRWLSSLNVWPRIEKERHAPFDQVRVWDGDGTADIFFTAHELGIEKLGYIVENRIALKCLREQLGSYDNIKLLCPEVVDEIDPPGRLKLQSGTSINANLIVAADGALSQIRLLSKFRTLEWNYGHSAIVTTVKAERPHDGWALHRFSSDGPLAFLPLPDTDGNQQSHRYSIVWCHSPDRVGELLQLSPGDRCRALAEDFEYCLGSIEEMAPCASYPLRQRHALGYAKDGVILIGDAAHTIHPLAGQGVNLGYRDAQVLADVVLQAHKAKRDIGDPSVLRSYQYRRVAPNLAMSGLMEGFKQLFAIEQPSIQWLRNLGIRTLDRQTLIKNEIVRLVLGI
jgi:2-octaprenylphenol hydroxylase